MRTSSRRWRGSSARGRTARSAIELAGPRDRARDLDRRRAGSASALITRATAQANFGDYGMCGRTSRRRGAGLTSTTPRRPSRAYVNLGRASCSTSASWPEAIAVAREGLAINERDGDGRRDSGGFALGNLFEAYFFAGPLGRGRGDRDRRARARPTGRRASTTSRSSGSSSPSSAFVRAGRADEAVATARQVGRAREARRRPGRLSVPRDVRLDARAHRARRRGRRARSTSSSPTPGNRRGRDAGLLDGLVSLALERLGRSRGAPRARSTSPQGSRFLGAALPIDAGAASRQAAAILRELGAPQLEAESVARRARRARRGRRRVAALAPRRASCSSSSARARASRARGDEAQFPQRRKLTAVAPRASQSVHPPVDDGARVEPLARSMLARDRRPRPRVADRDDRPVAREVRAARAHQAVRDVPAAGDVALVALVVLAHVDDRRARRRSGPRARRSST